jgi:deoxyribonuclease-4
MHISGIEYDRNGEKKHLTLKESDFNYPKLLVAIKEFKITGMAICESPNLEEDGLLLRNIYYE